MAKYTIDLDYFCIESKKLIGDMCFYFETTLESDIWCDTANSMQESFEIGFKCGDIGSEIENPEIHNVREVVDDNGKLGNVVISNIVLLQNRRTYENQIRQMIAERYPQTEIKVWYK